MRTIGKYIALKIHNMKDKTTSGNIIIPDKYDIPEQREAEVISIGRDVKEDIKIGDRVLINAFVGRNNMRKGEDDSIRIVTIEEIYGVIE